MSHKTEPTTKDQNNRPSRTSTGQKPKATRPEPPPAKAKTPPLPVHHTTDQHR